MDNIKELLDSAFNETAEITLSANFRATPDGDSEGESCIIGSYAAIVFLLFKTMAMMPDFADCLLTAARMYKDRPELVEKFKGEVKRS